MAVRILYYPNCSSCKKALRWLDQHGVGYESIHIQQEPPSKSQLKRYWQNSGLPLRKMFNTSGKAYREGGWSSKLNSVSDDEALEALAEDGMLIKRPILESGTNVVVGFKPSEYGAVFGVDDET
ncbi:MAG: arsenate reductase family protein [Myxococcota bacterium]